MTVPLPQSFEMLFDLGTVTVCRMDAAIDYAAAVSAADCAALLAENADQQKVIAAYEMCNPPWAQALREIVEGAAAADEFLENLEAIYRLAKMARAALKETK